MKFSEMPYQRPDAEAAKKKKSRRAYLEDIRPAANGNYVYTGQCYIYDEEINTRGFVLLRLWLLILPALAACVASGLFTMPFMTPFITDTWYTIAPYGIEFVAVCSAVWAICRITGNGNILREYVRRQTFGALPLRCWIAAGFAAAGIVGASVYMLLHGTAYTSEYIEVVGEVGDQTFRCVAYLCLKAVTAVFCAFTARFAASVAWKETAEKV